MNKPLTSILLLSAILTGCGGSGGSSGGGDDTPTPNPQPATPDPKPAANKAPIVSQVSIVDANSGPIRHHDRLSASYAYSDHENDAEGQTRIEWYLDDAVVHSGTTFIPGYEAIGKAITLAITPAASSGEQFGETVKITTEQPVEETETLLFTHQRSAEIVKNINLLDVYATDGTAERTYKLASILANGKPVKLLDSWLLPASWFPQGESNLVNGFIITDGTESTVNLFTIPSAPELHAHSLFTFNDTVLFNGYDEAYGRELWISDGTASGTQRLKDLRDGEQDGSPTSFTQLLDKVYFSATDADGNHVLWVTDGTANGTKKIEPTVYNPAQLQTYKNTLVLVGTLDIEISARAMVFDPATNQIVALSEDDTPNSPNSRPLVFATENFIGITAELRPATRRLWISDGKEHDAQMVESPAVVFSRMFNTPLGLFGYSSATSDFDYRSLWHIKAADDISNFSLNGSNDYYVNNLFVFKNQLVLRAVNSENDAELYKVENSELVQIANINLTGSSTPYHFSPVNDVFLFIANDGERGKEIWQSSADSDSTKLFMEFTPDEEGSTLSLELSDSEG